jgi:hypothetical protein
VRNGWLRNKKCNTRKRVASFRLNLRNVMQNVWSVPNDLYTGARPFQKASDAGDNAYVDRIKNSCSQNVIPDDHNGTVPRKV